MWLSLIPPTRGMNHGDHTIFTFERRILPRFLSNGEIRLRWTIHRKNPSYELQIEHRDLDEVVDRLASQHDVDQLMMRRLKLRKLRLKDQISLLKSELIPDLDA